MSERSFRVTFVPGVTPDKWVRTWRARFPEQPLEARPVAEVAQLDALHTGEAEVAFVRLPVEREGLHVIALYEEVPVAVLPRAHLYAELDSVDLADLTEEYRLDLSAMTVKQAVEVVASGTGAVVLPMSVARLHHRKDVVAVPVRDAERTRIGLAWPTSAQDERIQRFVGVVRGRTERSSRGGDSVPQPKQAGRKEQRQPGGESARRRSGSSRSSHRRRPRRAR